MLRQMDRIQDEEQISRVKRLKTNMEMQKNLSKQWEPLTLKTIKTERPFKNFQNLYFLVFTLLWATSYE